jgi:hypothetical protein
MTSKYASLLFPPDRYHHIGPFRFPVYHDLVPGEARGMEEIARMQSKAMLNSLKLAKRIAKDKKITTKEAVDLLDNADTDTDQSSIVFDYPEELAACQESTVSPITERVEYVTLFLRYRGEAKLNSKEWESLSDWSKEDTEAMPSETVSEIFTLISWERNGWPVEGKSDPKTEETTE